MKKYDVLILCLFFYPDQVTASRLACELAHDLVAKGLKVRVLCGLSKNDVTEIPAPKKETIDGIEIRRLKYIQLPRTSKLGRIINYFSFFLSVVFNWPRLLNNKCTIVYSDPPILPLVASINKSLFKVKYLFVSNDIYPDIALATKQIKENSFIHKMMNKVNRRMDKNVDQIVALSHDMKAHILRTREKISEEKITVIPNWYDHRHINFEDRVREVEIVKLREVFPLIVLYSGNMGIAQDLHTILETAKVFKENRDVLFVFTGNGKHADMVKSEIEKHQLTNAKFYDFLTGTTYTDMLKAADAHIVSLMEGLEGMAVPSKTYSYMSVGKPLIAIMADHTDIAKDIVTNDLGCVLQQGEIEKFSEYILYLLHNKAEIEKIGKRVREVFNENYTREMSVNKYYEAITEIIR